MLSKTKRGGTIEAERGLSRVGRPVWQSAMSAEELNRRTRLHPSL